MTAIYDNSQGMWEFNTYQTNLETGNASQINSEKLSLEKGTEYMQNNF